MPPKKSKAFASHFASSDEEEEHTTNTGAKPPAAKAKPGRKPKANASTAQEEAPNPPPLIGSKGIDDDIIDGEYDGDIKDSSENSKPVSTRRGRGGRGGRGGASLRGDRGGSKAKTGTAAARKDKAVAKRGGRSRAAKSTGAGEAEVGDEEEQEKSVSETQMPDDVGQDDEDDEDDEAKDIEMTVDETVEEILPSHPKQTVPKPTKGNRSRKADTADASHSEDDLPAKRRDRKPEEVEELTRKYNELLKLRTTNAESALNSFKENMKQKDIASKKLIDTLKSEADAATALSAKSKELQDEIKKASAKLQEKEKQLLAQQRAFESLQRENEQLAAKLKSSRPGGGGPAVGGSSSSSSLGSGGATFRDISSMKEELYGDLSGLIIRTVQDDNEGQIVYDCLQTGRNGTLHFKLSVSSSALSKRSDGYNCADSEITYTPLLDLRRDKLLDEILPDYLKEEITFPREKSSGFYLRLANSLQNAQVSR